MIPSLVSRLFRGLNNSSLVMDCLTVCVNGGMSPGFGLISAIIEVDRKDSHRTSLYFVCT